MDDHLSNQASYRSKRSWRLSGCAAIRILALRPRRPPSRHCGFDSEGLAQDSRDAARTCVWIDGRQGTGVAGLEAPRACIIRYPPSQCRYPQGAFVEHGGPGAIHGRDIPICRRLDRHCAHVQGALGGSLTAVQDRAAIRQGSCEAQVDRRGSDGDQRALVAGVHPARARTRKSPSRSRLLATVRIRHAGAVEVLSEERIRPGLERLSAGLEVLNSEASSSEVFRLPSRAISAAPTSPGRRSLDTADRLQPADRCQDHAYARHRDSQNDRQNRRFPRWGWCWWSGSAGSGARPIEARLSAWPRSGIHSDGVTAAESTVRDWRRPSATSNHASHSA